MNMKAMVEAYNKATGKNVKRFSSITAARKACVKAGIEVGDAPAARVKKVKAVKPAAVDKDRSEAIKDTWTDKKIRAARSARHAVHVVGHGDFKSVATAFKELGLPLGKHIIFRTNLVKEGKNTIESTDGKKYTFKLTEKAAAA